MVAHEQIPIFAAFFKFIFVLPRSHACSQAISIRLENGRCIPISREEYSRLNATETSFMRCFIAQGGLLLRYRLPEEL
jgi:hypothetical protein